MSKFLPTGGFKWINPTKFDLNKETSNSSKNCLFEVDLEYPIEVHDLQKNYPSAPDKLEIKKRIVIWLWIENC